MMRVITSSGVELEADRHTIRRVRARAWQVAVVVVCVLAVVGLVAGWLIACAVSGCSGEPEGALAYNIRYGIYGNEMCDFEEVAE